MNSDIDIRSDVHIMPDEDIIAAITRSVLREFKNPNKELTVSKKMYDDLLDNKRELIDKLIDLEEKYDHMIPKEGFEALMKDIKDLRNDYTIMEGRYKHELNEKTRLIQEVNDLKHKLRNNERPISKIEPLTSSRAQTIAHLTRKN